MLANQLQRLQVYICTRNWSALPAPVWYLVASPLLSWSMGGPRFVWPKGCSKSPWERSFWQVSKGL